MNPVSIAIAVAATVIWLSLIAWMLTTDGGVRHWWHDAVARKYALQAILGFGFVVTIFWFIPLFGKSGEALWK